MGPVVVIAAFWLYTEHFRGLWTAIRPPARVTVDDSNPR